ncbi:hypothetical protein TNCV_2999691 [Trichonephila clavipes]|nr:hypothetical protein TNCV_2999691 [Trichonephila clavipes]
MLHSDLQRKNNIERVLPLNQIETILFVLFDDVDWNGHTEHQGNNIDAHIPRCYLINNPVGNRYTSDYNDRRLSEWKPRRLISSMYITIVGAFIVAPKEYNPESQEPVKGCL